MTSDDRQKPKETLLESQNKWVSGRIYFERWRQWNSKYSVNLNWISLYLLCIEAPFVFFTAHSTQIPEPIIRVYGMALQIFGFLLTIYGIDNRVAILGNTSVFSRFVAFFKTMPLSPRAGTVHLVAASIEARPSFGIGRMTVLPSENATIDERVRIIEEKLSGLFDEVGRMQQKARENFAEIDKKLRTETANRETELKKIQERLKLTFGDNVFLEIVGVLFFALGIVFATASPEIALWWEQYP